ncbi:glycine--tRNA ligase subunit beta [Blochmannia endosymbiont of Camponotus (Colobopsis) obliquus]|uniref:glycine--tRNA ligase subunit beta n=1 Tax=Blochmannia endosymbiont of Camponotus (Colobopsis) obliquus TaxID=1505597 RepID=UPI00061A7EF4|nr:glycine--tRNA ligase subunit beta [Blochmannia endosymbiont of Camponotus (Colobopsis) obliquus]AKC60205.1 Glycine--tRNA ligase beta subunit [Blochmannia endosymbiont of Camponotus (Colobopsis) obliquus]
MKHTFFVEIGTEELPSRRLQELAKFFANNIHIELNHANIVHQEIKWFATSRRLAVKVVMLIDIHIYGFFENISSGIMQVFVDNGSPWSVIINNWAVTYNVKVKCSKYIVYSKNKWFMYRELMQDDTVHHLLCKVINNALKKTSNRIFMRWGKGDFKFIRPIHTVTVLLNDHVVSGNIFGININRIICSHRFMGKSDIILSHADDYPSILMQQGFVISNYNQRKKIIQTGIKEVVKKIGGVVKIEDSFLVEELTSLVEWPIVLVGSFKPKFLKLPKEVLIDVIEYNQKHFVVTNENKELLPYFIFVINVKSTNREAIINGHETVIYSKLTDASYFFNIDSIVRLESYLPHLNNILFHRKIGTLLDKTKRIEKLSAWIAIQLNADVSQAVRAAKLAKCDLLSNMVIEFPRTQGAIGMHYARRDGESEVVSLAQKEYYYPRFSGDILPNTQISCILAIADRIDTISGIFSIKEYPKGNGDPFALRRAAIGILRIIIEKRIFLNLSFLVKQSVDLYNNNLSNKYLVDKIIDFLQGRLCIYYQNRGYRNDVIRVILKNSLVNLIDFEKRLNVLHNFCRTEGFFLLKVLTKRVFNIIIKDDMISNDRPQVFLLRNIEEFNLFVKLFELDILLSDMLKKHCYLEILIELLKLSKLINVFFDHVMIMVQNDELRINRLSLLSKAYRLLTILIDFSLLK